MIPGEILALAEDVEINAGLPTATLEVTNSGALPITVGSHYHFMETNPALGFDRAATRGMRLDIPAGSTVRFEAGETRSVTLVAYRGSRLVFGFAGKVMGKL